MLAVSSFSGLSVSQATSGYSESVDLDLVAEIVERAPRGATGFPAAYKAYVQVLEENDVAPAQDTAYYQFLLRLQVIKAPTWGEKWDVWRSTHDIPLSTGFSKRDAAASPRIRDTARLASVRSRVPFLAGASSDLDDAFGETSYSADGEDEGASEDLEQAQPDPRRSPGRPAVRKYHAFDHQYTSIDFDQVQGVQHASPGSAVDYDTAPSSGQSPRSGLGLDLRDLPMRTSTPQYLHARPVFAYPQSTPPPYTPSATDASAVSERLDGLESIQLSIEDAQLIEGLATPKALAREWAEQRVLEDEVVREMERRAELYYHTGLVGRTWDVWLQAHDWLQKTTEQIDAVRSKMLLRQCLTRWRRRTDGVLDLPNTAEQHRKHHLLRTVLKRWNTRYRYNELSRREVAWSQQGDAAATERTWAHWRAKFIQLRTQRWEKDMRAREKRFGKSRDYGLMQDVMDRWRGETRTRVDTRLAITIDATRLLRDTLLHWSLRAEQKQRLDGQLLMFQRQQRVADLHTVLETWAHRCRTNRTAIDTAMRSQRALVVRVWDDWRIATAQNGLARRFAARKLVGTAFMRWRARVTEHADRERTADRMIGKQDISLLRHVIRRWIVLERSRLLERVLEQRQTKEAWAKWTAQMRRNTHMAGRAEVLLIHFDQRRARTAITTWRYQLQHRAADVQAAGTVYEYSRLRTSLAKWSAAAKKVKEDQQKADKARAFFALRQAMSIWKGELAVRRQHRFLREKELGVMRATFQNWREVTLRDRRDNAKADRLREDFDQSLVSACLSGWTNRVITLKSRHLDIAEARDTELIRTTLTTWVRKRRSIADRSALAESFYDVKAEDRLRSMVAHWRDAAGRKRFRRVEGDRLRRERRSKVLVGAWARWRERIAEKQLEPVAAEVSLRHEDAILFAVWDKWKARATLLPAITFDQRRLKRLAWRAMQSNLERARAVKTFGGPRDRHLLADILAIWRAKTAVQIAAKHGRVRGRMRPFSGAAAPDARQAVMSRSSQHITRPRPRPSSMVHDTSYGPSMGRPSVIARATFRSPRQLPAGGSEEDAETVYSEPAYERLRTELGRRRGGSEDPDARI